MLALFAGVGEKILLTAELVTLLEPSELLDEGASDEEDSGVGVGVGASVVGAGAGSALVATLGTGTPGGNVAAAAISY